MKLQDIALETLQHFKCMDAGSLSPTWRTVDNPPSHVLDMVKISHGDYLPDDFKYRFIVEALDSLSKCEEIADVHMKPDDEPRMLTGWLHSKINRLNYITRAMAESNSDDSLTLLKTAQLIEKNEILAEVTRYLKEIIKNKK